MKRKEKVNLVLGICAFASLLGTNHILQEKEYREIRNTKVSGIDKLNAIKKLLEIKNTIHRGSTYDVICEIRELSQNNDTAFKALCLQLVDEENLDNVINPILNIQHQLDSRTPLNLEELEKNIDLIINYCGIEATVDGAREYLSECTGVRNNNDIEDRILSSNEYPEYHELANNINLLIANDDNIDSLNYSGIPTVNYEELYTKDLAYQYTLTSIEEEQISNIISECTKTRTLTK